jgi:hypothetical protein
VIFKPADLHDSQIAAGTFLSVWSRAILSDRSFLSLDDVRIQPREAPFDLTMKVGVE